MSHLHKKFVANVRDEKKRHRSLAETFGSSSRQMRKSKLFPINTFLQCLDACKSPPPIQPLNKILISKFVVRGGIVIFIHIVEYDRSIWAQPCLLQCSGVPG